MLRTLFPLFVGLGTLYYAQTGRAFEPFFAVLSSMSLLISVQANNTAALAVKIAATK